MFDSSLYPFEENMAQTKAVVELAGRYGAAMAIGNACGHYPVAPSWPSTY